MAGGTSVSLLHDIQVLFDAGTASGLSDRQLLERFTSRRDAAAFEVLVMRHGPMVLRVCRNLLHDPNDAQDAFQATFLILVRRSGSIRRLDSVGSWLYGVASRVSARLRGGAARRRAAEERAASLVREAVAPSGGAETDREEFGPIVQEEVRRLPEKYRAAVVLCYWQGLTQEQAAVQLGIPLGTVRSRVARARDLLRSRLTRRGLAALAGIIAAGRDESSASAAFLRLAPIPAELVQATVRAVSQVAGGQAASPLVSGVVASLVQRILWSMTMIKIGGVVASVVLVGMAGYGVGTAAQKAGQPQSVQGVGQVGDNNPRSDGQPQPPQPQAAQEAKPVEKAQLKNVTSLRTGVEGGATVIAIRKSGTVVKKGEVICELDSTQFRDQRTNQAIVVIAAKAASETTRLTREVAEIAVIEYREGIFAQDLETLEGELRVAMAELDLAQEVLKAAIDAGSDKSLAVKRAELDIFRSKIAVKKAQGRRDVLVNYTKPRTLKELQSEVQKAKAEELGKQAALDLEMQKLTRLDRLIANCSIVAPFDGTIQHVAVSKGMRVPDRQVLLTIVPSDGDRPR